VYTVGLGNRLTASTAFPALSLLNTLRQPMMQLPNILTQMLVEGRVSLERMQVFLAEADIARYVDRRTGAPPYMQVCVCVISQPETKPGAPACCLPACLHPTGQTGCAPRLT
jgi:ABC-type multidrug transport system fused ATPase/permease subunit